MEYLAFLDENLPSFIPCSFPVFYLDKQRQDSMNT